MRQGGPSAARRRFARLLAYRPGELGRAAHDSFEAELAERRGFLWLAVSFGSGALAYFALPAEPPLAALAAAPLVLLLPAIAAPSGSAVFRLAVVLAVCAAGAAAAELRVLSLQGPVTASEFAATVEGRVVGREARSDRRPRIVLDRLIVDGGAGDAAAVPERLRLTLPAAGALPPLGARIRLRARLMPVPGPAVPGAYDPRRAAFFEGIGGSGFALGGWTPVAVPEPGDPALVVATIRQAVVARIRQSQPGEAGAVAAALLVGERSQLSAETNDSLRASGLAHVLSISGLHMMLVAGTAFFVLRAGLALSPRLALVAPIRKWAAAAAIVVAAAYLAVSGGNVATVRAFVMAAILFAAILADRPAISMRNLALATFVVVALEPESVVEPGFQMSFAAVAALVAGWEAWYRRDRLRLADAPLFPGQGALAWVGRVFLGTALTTLIASLATAPYGAYHFERVATYSLLGNLLAMPVVSAVVMPFGLLALAVMPVGLEGPPLAVMAFGIEAMLAISAWVARLPGAMIASPPIPPASLAAITAGLLWLCLWQRPWRRFGLLPIGLGLLLVPALRSPPDVLATPDGWVVAVRDAGGTLRVSGGRDGTFALEQIYEGEGGRRPPAEAIRQGLRCDPAACLMSGRDGLRVSHVRRAEAFAEDCAAADIVVTPLFAPDWCGAALVIDAERLARFGAHAVRLTEEAAAEAVGRRYRVDTARQAVPRPWQRP